MIFQEGVGGGMGGGPDPVPPLEHLVLPLSLILSS